MNCDGFDLAPTRPEGLEVPHDDEGHFRSPVTTIGDQLDAAGAIGRMALVCGAAAAEIRAREIAEGVKALTEWARVMANNPAPFQRPSTSFAGCPCCDIFHCSGCPSGFGSALVPFPGGFGGWGA